MYTLYYYNSGGEREEWGTFKNVKAAKKEMRNLQDDWEDVEATDDRFEIVLEFV